MLDKVPNSRSLDNLAISCLAHTGINATRNTVFSGIKKLLAGETIVYNISNKKIKSRKRIFIKPISNIGFDPEGFRRMAHKTVKMCSIGKRKIGVFLSGGLDSSLIAYELKNIMGEANTFTNQMDPNVIRGGENYNEDAICAQELADANNFNHKEVIITPKIIEDYWNDSIYFMEQPAYNPSLAMYCYTNKVLHDNGIVVTMAGDMGDEILGGYPKYWKMKKLKFKSWAAIVDHWTRRIKRPIALIKPNHSGLKPWLLVDTNNVRKELLKCYPDDLWNPEDPIGSYMALDCVTQVPEEFFNRNDKYGMAYGMEGRFPLATKMFMQYCMNIHSHFKIGSAKGDTKMLSKIAYDERLPDKIITKMKTGWTVPLREWWNKNNKADIPAMIVKDWIKTYKIKT
jgi:asparagine synthase (glutamine-hydrolysing)